jgi:CcmD family protein
MNDIAYVYIAYTIIFLGIAFYIFYLHQKQTQLARDIELLEESVKYHAKEKRRKRRDRK